MSVQGVKEIAKAVKHHQGATAKGLKNGLARAGLFLQRESQKIVPVEFGTLKNSAGTRMEGQGFRVAAVVSYGTEYAIYVHENLEARHKPGKTAKFLERPLREKADRLKAIVAEGIQGAI